MAEQQKPSRTGVTFSSTLIGIFGLVAGIVIATGVPAMILVMPSATTLSSGATAAVIITALVMGAGIATVSAFFGIVIPNKVGGSSSMPQEKQETRREKK